MRTYRGNWACGLGIALAATAMLYGGCQLVAGRVFGLHIDPAAVPLDLGFHLGVSALIYTASRRLWANLVLQLLLVGTLHLGHAVKTAFYGGPLMPDDLASLPALLRIAEGPAFLGLVALLGLLALLTVGNIDPSRKRSRAAIAGLAGIAGLVTLTPGPVTAALDGLYGHVDWNPRGNLERRGPAIHLVQETARRFAASGPPPGPAEVARAAEALLARRPSREAPAGVIQAVDVQRVSRRNVHMIVMESFWDAGLLTPGHGLTADPFPPEFRALWDAAGNSRALSPVFGGHTANAEFEALCGLPVMNEGVVFETRLRRDVPCLPRLLADAGYETVASHPNTAAFWNRINAYRRVGFGTYWSDRDFVLDDMNDGFLSDASLYTQVLDKLEPLMETGTPTFNYILTFFGHLGYPLNAARPPVIGSDGQVWLVQPYADTAHYKAAELMEMLARLRARDPDGLIVIFGDHLPFLGFNFDGYTQAGLLHEDRGSFTPEMVRTVSATPLIIIDGQNGAVPVGDLPIYRIPGLILELLGLETPSIMDYTATPPGLTIRPFPGHQLILAEGRSPRSAMAETKRRPAPPRPAGWRRWR
ncbi:LTA synthase family protein [Indioceanicola profundi]|uniref:LTA synthase family protein n=1 Tax=Indioceanicola profundi TaxID=2220096 RepID=UPI000E6ACEE2|nr:LTA synthase family protein [Indioceanicola profundi]